MDGIILLNKDKNVTSNTIINKIKKELKLNKVGHIGTLDPNATGLLPVLVNKAKKLSNILINHDKSYYLEAILGLETDTLDITGNILNEENIFLNENINKSKLINILDDFKNNYFQTPPMYSAVKYQGKKLYEYARKNIKIEINSRKVNLYNYEIIDLKNYQNKILFTMNIDVSSGFYVRSLIDDIAKKLKTFGCLKDLKRTKVSNFLLEDSSTYEEIINNKYKFISLLELLKDYDNVILDEYLIKLVRNGVILDNRQYHKNKLFKIFDKNNNLIAIYYPYDNLKFNPLVIL